MLHYWDVTPSEKPCLTLQGCTYAVYVYVSPGVCSALPFKKGGMVIYGTAVASKPALVLARLVMRSVEMLSRHPEQYAKVAAVQ